VNEDQQPYSEYQDRCGDPELNIRQDGPYCAGPATAFIIHDHLPLIEYRNNVTDYEKLRYRLLCATVKKSLESPRASPKVGLSVAGN
jgi:hypothetical protein